MDNYAMSQRKSPLTSVRGIIFMVAGAVFLLPYLVASVPSLMTFFISLFKVFANLFSFSGQGLSLAFASLTPLLSSFFDLLQCFVGPVSLVLCFILIAFRNEEKACVFAVLNLVSSLITLLGGKVSLATPVWAINVLADLVLAVALLAFSLCEGKLRNSQRWIMFAMVSCVIRIAGFVFGMVKDATVYPLEYYPVFDYEAFIASFRQFVTAVLDKKSIASEVKLANYSFTFNTLAEGWAGYVGAADALNKVPVDTINWFDGARSMAKPIAASFNSQPELVNLLYIVSSCLTGLFGFVMVHEFKQVKE